MKRFTLGALDDVITRATGRTGPTRAVPADQTLPGASTFKCNMPEHIARGLTGGGPYP